MKARFAVAGIALLAAASLAPAPSIAQTSASTTRRAAGDDRFFLRFVEDAGIVPSYWLEGKAAYTSNSPAFDEDIRGAGEADLLTLGPVFALNVAEDLEFGARVAMAYRDPSHAGRDTGLTDLDLWGKISVVSDPVRISLGLLISAPTGSEDKFLGSGETDVEFFGGLRKDFSHLTLAGNAGLRINQDPDFGLVQLEGKNSILLGAGVLVPVGTRLALSAEWAMETERYEGMKNDSRLMGGAQYRVTESLMIRGAAGGGLSKGAPDFELTGSAVWLF